MAAPASAAGVERPGADKTAALSVFATDNSLKAALARGHSVVFFDVAIAGSAVGRISIELFDTVAPRAAENFRQLCTGETRRSGQPIGYKGSPFHRVIPGFMVQGGDIPKVSLRSNGPSWASQGRHAIGKGLGSRAVHARCAPWAAPGSMGRPRGSSGQDRRPWRAPWPRDRPPAPRPCLRPTASQGDGTGSLSIYGSRFADEPEGLALRHGSAGMVSMANSGSNTNGCQFFVCMDACPWLDGKHVVVGRLLDDASLLVARKLEAVPTVGERPSVDVTVVECGQL